MPIIQLEENSTWFPDAELWDEKEGIVAIGGSINPKTLLAAYQKGIFPWNEPESEILWWSPLERMVLRPEDVHISKSSRNLLNQKKFKITFNQAFDQVLEACKKIDRPGQNGTWITEDHVSSFKTLHEQGHAFSVEAWLNNELVGGLYGLSIGASFSGESMFSKVSNAGKICFIHLCKRLEYWGIPLIDCQVYNSYLASLGAYRVSRASFMRELKSILNDHPDWEEIFK
jgi:leucyl/phenylalanyl-tRNA--protein transferase